MSLEKEKKKEKILLWSVTAAGLNILLKVQFRKGGPLHNLFVVPYTPLISNTYTHTHTKTKTTIKQTPQT